MPAIVIPANLSTIYWRNPITGQTGSFRPSGPIETYTLVDGYEPNPPVTRWRDPGQLMLSARFVVGFNVKSKPTWTVDDLIKVVRSKRSKQHQKPDSSFIAQRGIYSGGRKLVVEDGAQVVIFNIFKVRDKTFVNQMIAVADEIADKLKQDTVILEIQRGGVVEESMGIGHKPGRR
jgi:hypothetical protein